MGEWQQFLKSCQCLSASTLVPAVREESIPPKEKKSANKTSTARLSCGGWHGDGLLSANLCRVYSQPLRKPHFHPGSPAAPPVFQPVAFCGVEGFFLPFFPSLNFSWFHLDRSLRERSSWHPTFHLVLYLQQPSKMENKCLKVLLGLFVVVIFLVEVVVVLLDLQKFTENSGEEKASCYHPLSLGRAATPLAGIWGAYWAMPWNGNSVFALLPSSAENFTGPTEEETPFTPATIVAAPTIVCRPGEAHSPLWVSGESPSCLPRAPWCRSSQGFLEVEDHRLCFVAPHLGFNWFMVFVWEMLTSSCKYPVERLTLRMQLYLKTWLYLFLQNPDCGTTASTSLWPWER